MLVFIAACVAIVARILKTGYRLGWRRGSNLDGEQRLHAHSAQNLIVDSDFARHFKRDDHREIHRGIPIVRFALDVDLEKAIGCQRGGPVAVPAAMDDGSLVRALDRAESRSP